MDKGNRQNRSRPNSRPNNFKVVDLGACIDRHCPNFYPAISHRHAYAYLKGRATPELIRMIEKSLKTLGYVGEPETETLPLQEFTRRYGFTL